MSSSKLSESSDDKDEEFDITVTEDINGDSGGNGGGERNIDTGGGSAEWLGFLSPGAQTEALGDTAKAKTSSSTALIKKPKLGKSKSKLARKGKAS